MRFTYITKIFVSSCYLNEIKKDISVITKDVLKLYISGGNGGHGIPRFNGVGGNGGSVFLQVDPQLSFQNFCIQYENNKIQAENGEQSLQTKLVGRNGKDTIINVPHGVECVNESSLLLARCLSLKKRYLLAKGGHGGCAQNKYKGTTGESMLVYVHLKLKPNVGFLGFPNAGKSTLLKALVPNKSVKIANYPFTTLKPQMCYLKYAINSEEEKEAINMGKQLFTLSFADLPGIIEGASRNRGVGHSFLKHLEYSDIIAMIVDVHGFQLEGNIKEPFRTPLETIALLNREVETYSKKLIKKNFILIFNKIDISNGEQKAKDLTSYFYGETFSEKQKWAQQIQKDLRPRNPIVFDKVLSISAKKNELGNLKEILKKLYEKLYPPTHIIFNEIDNNNRTILC